LIRAEAIVLYPYVLFAQPRQKISASVLRHELIHVRQVRQIGWFRFYLSYLLEYSRHLWRLRDHYEAYLAISYEAEAFRLQDRLTLEELLPSKEEARRVAAVFAGLEGSV
jgi:hypothetical protein